jgi:hypothetical protein
MKKTIYVLLCVLCIFFLSSCALFTSSYNRNDNSCILSATNVAIHDFAIYENEILDKCAEQGNKDCKKGDKIEEWLLFLESIEKYFEEGKLDTINTIVNNIIKDMKRYEVDSKIVTDIENIKVVLDLKCVEGIKKKTVRHAGR